MTKLIILLLFLTACGDHSKISKKSSSQSTYSVIEETVLDISMSRNFDFLPLKGEVEKNGRFWSGDSWRLSRGAINYRWNAPEKMGFHYHSPTYREAVTLPQKLIRELAPSEKYDLWKGRYDYPLKMEVDALALTYTAEWEGLCHGWAPASMYHPDQNPGQ